MSYLIENINLTDSFFDELKKSKLTFDYKRIKFPLIVYKGKTYLSITRLMRTAWCGSDFGNTLHEKVQKNLMYKLVLKNIVEECNIIFSGGLIAIHYIYTPKYEYEPNETISHRQGIFMRYAKLILPAEERRWYNEKKELEKYAKII